MSFVGDQTQIDFLSNNPSLISIQNDKNYELKKIEIIQQKELFVDNAIRSNIIVEIVRPMASTYYKFEATFDLYKNTYLKVLFMEITILQILQLHYHLEFYLKLI